MPKVSVIVPVYNVQDYLARCLDSLLNQTMTDYEIICINDDSPDKSQKILESYKEKHPDRIKVLVNKKNIGLGKTRERGIRHANGTYIMFVDSDDYVKCDYIETYLTAMEHQSCDIIIGGYIRDVNGKLTEHIVSNSIWSNLTYAIVCAKMFRKEFIVEKELEFTDIRCGEDIYFSLCAFYMEAKYAVINYAGYYYYFNRKSITGSMNHAKNHERFISTIFNHFLEKYDLNKISEERQRAIEYTYVANIINALISFGHGAGPKRMKQKYQFAMQDLKIKFPNYKSNPYFGLLKPKGQTKKIRLGVGVMMFLHKLHLDLLFLYIISFI